MNKNIVLNAGKALVAVAAAVAATEAFFHGTSLAEADVKFVKELASPTPIYVKKGRFGKKRLVTVNQVTGEIKDYTGSKKPVDDKVYRI